MLIEVLLVLLILAALGALPNWGWHGRGYTPSGVVVVVLIILVVLLATNRI